MAFLVFIAKGYSKTQMGIPHLCSNMLWFHIKIREPQIGHRVLKDPNAIGPQNSRVVCGNVSAHVHGLVTFFVPAQGWPAHLHANIFPRLQRNQWKTRITHGYLLCLQPGEDRLHSGQQRALWIYHHPSQPDKPMPLVTWVQRIFLTKQSWMEINKVSSWIVDSMLVRFRNHAKGEPQYTLAKFILCITSWPGSSNRSPCVSYKSQILCPRDGHVWGSWQQRGKSLPLVSGFFSLKLMILHPTGNMSSAFWTKNFLNLPYHLHEPLQNVLSGWVSLLSPRSPPPHLPQASPCTCLLVLPLVTVALIAHIVLLDFKEMCST